MILPLKQPGPGQKIYFASDFHLGAPNPAASRQREDSLVRWLDMCRQDASAIFLVGDIFDFWFEYRHVVPKGFIRLQGKLAQLADAGIELVLFTGNHDMWMFDYFEKEIGARMVRQQVTIELASHTLMVGHGDGLGPGDHFYKLLKRIFANRACQWAFNWLHPAVGMGIANAWSGRSRLHNDSRDQGYVRKESEWLYQWCQEEEQRRHHDYYIFGHRHLPLELAVNDRSTYINLGEWISQRTYAVYDQQRVSLLRWEG